MIGATLGQYRITAKLGAGGMGEVWRAEDAKLGREVALKVLPEEFAADPDRMARFEREAKVLASLNHPNIATLYGLETVGSGTGPTTFLAMELVEGEDLSERIARGPIPVDEAIPIALLISEALEAAHEQGIVHRDLKPANIKLRPDGTVKVLDFGLAMAWEAETGDSSLSLSPTITRHATVEGVILGTAAYMSPEQARGKKVDRRADIWSFGVVLWEMLTGEKLFAGETVSDVLAAVLTRDPDLDALPNDTPVAVRRLLTRCMRRDPKRRLQWIGDARLELESLDDEDTAAALGAGGAPRSVTKALLPWLVAVVAATVAVAAVVWSTIGSAPVGSPVVGIIGPPDGHDLEFLYGFSGSISVSPDGRNITFSATDADRDTRLWLRPVGALQAEPIAGTEGAGFPFWSPDSRHLAFFADGKLRRVALDGSPVVTVCDAPTGRSGSWNSDGVIIFSPTVEDPIHRVAAGGGAAEPITALDLGRGESTHRWATFLPDGRHFLFLAASHAEGANSEAHGIWVGELGTQERRLLIRNRGNAVYASGHLLYVRERILMAHPFDLDRLELVGDPRPVVEGVGVDWAYFRGDFAASLNGILAYRGGDVNNEAQLHWVELGGTIVEPVGEPARILGVEVAPDGKRVALVITDPETATDDIWIQDLDRDVRTRVTFGRLDEHSPVWSPDGSRIAFAASEGSDKAEIFLVRVDGGEPELLYAADGSTLHPFAWSPDGRTLLLNTRPSDDSSQDIWALPVDGGEPYRVVATDANESGTGLSPDGRWLHYLSDGSGATVAFATPFPAADRRWQITGEASFAVKWKSDNEIFYVNDRGEHKTIGLRVNDNSLSFGRPVVHGSLQRRVVAGDVEPGGQRALLAMHPEAEEKLPIVLIANWLQALGNR